MRTRTNDPGEARSGAPVRGIRTRCGRGRGAAAAPATLAVFALAAAGCICPSKPAGTKPPADAAPAVAKAAPAAEPAPAERSEPHRRTALARPDLSADWNWSGQALPTGDLSTSVLTVETFSPVRVNANSEYDYRVRVTNVAETMHLSDVRVTDRLPGEGYEFVSANPGCERSGDTLSWAIPHLAPGESREFTVRGRATEVGTVKECASAEYTPHVCVETAVVAPEILLEKFAPAEVSLCDDVPLRYVVRNTGTGDATRVAVVGELPEGWTVAGRPTVRFDVGTLPQGQSRELTAVARASKTGKFVARAKATGDGDLVSEASAPVAVRQPKIEITTDVGAGTQFLGRDSTFRVTVKNTGDWPARDFVLKDTFGGAEKIVAASDGGQVSGSVVAWNLGTLAPGASRTVTVTANRATEGPVTATAAASAFCAEPVSAAAKTTYRGIPAVLVEVVDDADPLPLGEPTTYTITVTNQGTAADTDIVVNCTLEDTVEFVAAGGATKATRTGSKVSFAPLASLAPKEVVRWTVTVRGLKEADTRFSVTVDTKETERAISETEATRVFKFDF